MYNQREIVFIPFPYSDLTGAKQRPALIISNSKLNKTEDRICCLITSNQSIEGIEIKKSSFEQGSLPFQSWIKPYRLFTIHERIIKRKLCTVNSGFYQKVVDSISEYLKAD